MPSSDTSTNRPIDTNQPDDLPDINGGLKGNNIGGKNRRKRSVDAHEFVDVMLDGDDDNANSFDNEHGETNYVLIDKRILVNISVAMDGGMGTNHQEVYQLQIAVPLPRNKFTNDNFYTYEVRDSDEQSNDEQHVVNATTSVDDSTTLLPEMNESSTVPSTFSTDDVTDSSFPDYSDGGREIRNYTQN